MVMPSHPTARHGKREILTILKFKYKLPKPIFKIDDGYIWSIVSLSHYTFSELERILREFHLVYEAHS